MFLRKNICVNVVIAAKMAVNIVLMVTKKNPNVEKIHEFFLRCSPKINPEIYANHFAQMSIRAYIGYL